MNSFYRVLAAFLTCVLCVSCAKKKGPAHADASAACRPVEADPKSSPILASAALVDPHYSLESQRLAPTVIQGEEDNTKGQIVNLHFNSGRETQFYLFWAGDGGDYCLREGARIRLVNLSSFQATCIDDKTQAIKLKANNEYLLTIQPKPDATHYSLCERPLSEIVLWKGDSARPSLHFNCEYPQNNQTVDIPAGFTSHREAVLKLEPSGHSLASLCFPDINKAGSYVTGTETTAFSTQLTSFEFKKGSSTYSGNVRFTRGLGNSAKSYDVNCLKDGQKIRTVSLECRSYIN